MMNSKGFRREGSRSERDTHHRQDDVKRGMGVVGVFGLVRGTTALLFGRFDSYFLNLMCG